MATGAALLFPLHWERNCTHHMQRNRSVCVFLHCWLQYKRKIQPGYKCPMGLEVLAACSGLFCLLKICSFPDCWWLSVLSKWIYFSGSRSSSCLCCLLLPVMFGVRHQETCWHCCPAPRRWVGTSGRAGQEGVQEECRPNSISHSPKNRFSTYDGQPLHSSSTSEVRTTYHIFSTATFIGWLAAERTSDGLKLDVELAGDMWLYKRNGIGRLLSHSSSEWETVLW